MLIELSSKTMQGLAEIPENLPIAVYGDLMVDHYVWGSVDRLCPEAPVPVLNVDRESRLPGGAANVAENLAALGSEVTLIGRVGRDPEAVFLEEWFAGDDGSYDSYNVNYCPVVQDSYLTTIKQRYMCEHGQLLRCDYENTSPKRGNVEAEVKALFEKHLPCKAGFVISDYGKGFVDSKDISIIADSGLPTFIDCKPELFKERNSFGRFSCVAMTPNANEYREMGGKWENEQVVGLPGIHELLVTCGKTGINLVYEDEKLEHAYIPALAQEVFNVTGAGDTVLAVYTWARCGGIPPLEATVLASVAAAEVVKKEKTEVVTRGELIEALEKYFESRS